MRFDLILTISGFAILVLGGGPDNPTADVLFFRAPGHRTVLTYLPRNSQQSQVADPAVPNPKGRVLAQIELDGRTLRLDVGDPPDLDPLRAGQGFDLDNPELGAAGELSVIDLLLPLDKLAIEEIHPFVLDPERPFGGGTLATRLSIPAGRVGSTEIVVERATSQDGGQVRPVRWAFRDFAAPRGPLHTQVLADALQIRIENISSADFRIGAVGPQIPGPSRDRGLSLKPHFQDTIGASDRPQVEVSITNLPGVRITAPSPSLDHVLYYYRAAKDPKQGNDRIRPVRIQGDATSDDPFCPTAFIDLTATGQSDESR